MSYSECVGFEKKLAYHSAPALLGIKPACLFSVNRGEFCGEEIKSFNRKASERGLKLRKVCECKNRSLIMLYNESKLFAELHNFENAKMLEKFGYSRNMTTKKMLDRLAERIAKNTKFPHETGIFLGYPAEDVKGFIENNGENFKLCGYWKVYGDIETAKRTFENYNKCRKFLWSKLSQGHSIYQALRISQ